MTGSPPLRSGSRWHRERHILLLLVAALILMAPEFVWGLSPSDSLRYNLVWTDQFTTLFSSGDFYPRWLPNSWDGLGSPAFYIYPPLYFWLAAGIDQLTFGALSTERLISLASLLVLATSGLTMNRWLREQASPAAACCGALAYMAAPYHLNDIYVRGALGEACAYAILPLLLLGLRKLGQGRIISFVLVALAYAALILSHLPSALLVTLFLIPLYVVFEAHRTVLKPLQFAFWAGAGGVLGLGLAAFYLVPALTLMPFISYADLFGTIYSPAFWFFWSWTFEAPPWPSIGPVVLTVIVSMSAILAVAAVLITPHFRRLGDFAFWSVAAIVSVVMASGFAPFLWELPLVANVQFPFRFLLVTEFAVVTLAMAISRRVSLPMIGAILAWVCAFLVNAVAVASLYQWDETSRERWLASVWSEYRDAPEYVPPMTGSTIKPGQIPNATMIIIPEVPAVRLSAQGGTASESRRADGGALVVAKSPAPASLTLRRFYFPHWRVTTPDGKPVPVRRGELGLLAWDIPAGASRYVVSGGPVSGERLGNLVSLVALALLLLTGLAAATSTIRRDILMKSR